MRSCSGSKLLFSCWRPACICTPAAGDVSRLFVYLALDHCDGLEKKKSSGSTTPVFRTLHIDNKGANHWFKMGRREGGEREKVYVFLWFVHLRATATGIFVRTNQGA